MKLMKKTLVTLAVTLGISGALSPAVNAATKTTNASISVLNIITMADRVYFQYNGKAISTATAFQSAHSFTPTNWVTQNGISLINKNGSWGRIYQGKYTVGSGINAGKFGHVGVSFNKYIRTTILGNGQWTYSTFNDNISENMYMIKI